LHDGLGHLLGRLVQAGVDHLEAGVTQRPRDHLGPTVVTVEPGFGHDDSVAAIHGTAILGGCLRTPSRPSGTPTSWVVTRSGSPVTSRRRRSRWSRGAPRTMRSPR